jgi:hypothetical protein
MPAISNSTSFGIFQVQKDIVSSALTTSDVNIVECIGNGLMIEEVIVRTDATGLAGGTNFQLKADGVLFFSTAVAGLGASSAKDLRTASVTGVKVTVPAGAKYITVSNTVAVGTGAGVATVTLKLQKLDGSATAIAL